MSINKKKSFHFNSVALIITAVTWFSLMGLGVKLIPRIPFYEIIFFRSIISAALCIYTAYVRQLPLFGKRENLPLLIGRGAFGTVGLCCFFYSIHNLNLPYAITLYQLAPIFILFISAAIFKRKIHPVHWFSSAIAFLGIYWVYHTQIDSFDWVVSIGIIGAFFGGLAYQTIYQLKGRESASVVVFYFPLVAIPISGMMLLHVWVQPTLLEWIILLGIGFATHIAQLCLTKAYQQDEPAKLAIYNNLNVVLACLFSYFFLGESLTLHQIQGLVIIVFGLLLSSVADRRLVAVESS